MPYLPGIPALLTVYDLIPLRYPAHSTARARLLIRWMTRLALRTAKHVIAISEFTRRDFMAEFGLQPEQITAIPLAADPAFQPAATGERSRPFAPAMTCRSDSSFTWAATSRTRTWCDWWRRGRWQIADGKWQIAAW